MDNYHVPGIIFILLLAGCASVPTSDIKVYAAADPEADFGGYESYAWLGAAAIVNDALGQWEPPDFDADAEIKYLIDRELRSRGLSESSGDPDLVVAFAAGIDMDALGLKENPCSKTKTLSRVPKGGLIVALVDRRTGFVIWTAVATAEIQHQPNAATVKARLDHAVTKMFRKLPE